MFPGKAFGPIVNYNGILRVLRAALAQYALGVPVNPIKAAFGSARGVFR